MLWRVESATTNSDPLVSDLLYIGATTLANYVVLGIIDSNGRDVALFLA